jgi:hypothetical protein
MGLHWPLLLTLPDLLGWLLSGPCFDLWFENWPYIIFLLIGISYFYFFNFLFCFTFFVLFIASQNSNFSFHENSSRSTRLALLHSKLQGSGLSGPWAQGFLDSLAFRVRRLDAWTLIGRWPHKAASSDLFDFCALWGVCPRRPCRARAQAFPGLPLDSAQMRKRPVKACSRGF